MLPFPGSKIINGRIIVDDLEYDLALMWLSLLCVEVESTEFKVNVKNYNPGSVIISYCGCSTRRSHANNKTKKNVFILLFNLSTPIQS